MWGNGKRETYTTARSTHDATPHIDMHRVQTARQFCILKYRPSSAANKSVLNLNDKVIVLVVKDYIGNFSVRISPELWRMVRGDDVLCIYDILRDLPQRAKRYPDLMFQLLSSMSTAPLVTHKVGIDGVDDEDLVTHYAQFVDLNLPPHWEALPNHGMHLGGGQSCTF